MLIRAPEALVKKLKEKKFALKKTHYSLLRS
jgi:hypothetical protein